VSTKWLNGIIEWDPDDQVVVVWAGTDAADLQSELQTKGQCLPLPRTESSILNGIPGTVGGLIAMNLPHALSDQTGPVRDWVLGLALLRSDLTTAMCGSKSVKSVAGYDIHRFLSGAGGDFAMIGAAAMRTAPIGSVVDPVVEVSGNPDDAKWIQRVKRTDFMAVKNAEGVLAADAASSTLWLSQEPTRCPEDWLIGEAGLIEPSPHVLPFYQRAKSALDPTGRFVGCWPGSHLS
jgi:FAD/FMN-containing dehydrogenase